MYCTCRSVWKCDLICIARSIEQRNESSNLKGVPKRDLHANILMMMTVHTSMHPASILYVQFLKKVVFIYAKVECLDGALHVLLKVYTPQN